MTVLICTSFKPIAITRGQVRRRLSRTSALIDRAPFHMDENTRILPLYLETYVETICEHEANKPSCMENMIIPDVPHQQEILDQYNHIIQTNPLEDAPSIRYTILKLLIQGDESMLSKLMDMVFFYGQSVMMLSDAIRELNS